MQPGLILAHLLLVSLLIIPPSSGIYIAAPDHASSIASADVKDVINGRYGDVIFATAEGLSIYTASGTWYSVNARNPRQTDYGFLEPLDNMVTALALDPDGHLWLGYSCGLQMGNGTGYRAIQDQDHLKNLNINCIRRWDDEVWVATGSAGLHHWHDGVWTWYKPGGPEGAGFYTVVSMVVDAGSDALVIDSENEGVWVLKDRKGNLRFEQVFFGDDPLLTISGVRVDPFGGVYLFNRTTVLHYSPDGGVTRVLNASDLNTFPVRINDVAATRDGTLLIASDNGIYGLNSSGVVLHLTSSDGIRKNFVKRLFVDAYGRCWFVVPGHVGYIPPLQRYPTIQVL